MIEIKTAKLYNLLFIDSFIANIVPNINGEYAIHSMKVFGSYNSLMLIFTALLGSICAISVNYFIGSFLFKITCLFNNENLIKRRDSLLVNCLKHDRLFLLLSLVPGFGKFIILSAGFLGLGFKRTILVCSLYNFCYYIIVVYFY